MPLGPLMDFKVPKRKFVIGPIGNHACCRGAAKHPTDRWLVIRERPAREHPTRGAKLKSIDLAQSHELNRENICKLVETQLH